MKLSAVIATPDIENWPYQLFSGPFKVKIRKAAELGFHGVELVSRDLDLIELNEIRVVLKDHHLELAGLITGAMYGLDKLCLMSPDKNIENVAMKRFEKFLAFAGEYGAVVDVGLFRGTLRTMENPDSALGQLRETFHRSAQYAARCGSRITIEPLNRFEGDFIHNCPDGLDWVKKVNHSAFGLMLDSFHMNIEDASIYESIIQAGEALWHIHIGDSNRLAAGEGHFDFSEMLEALNKIHYTAFLSAEHLSKAEPDDSAARTCNYLSSLMETT